MPTAIAKARSIDELRWICRAEALEADMLRSFFVETGAARDPHRNIRDQIRTTLAGITDARILFYGHRGCGKSTELNKLSEELAAGYAVVKFSVEKEMNMTQVFTEDLLLVICEQLLRFASFSNLHVEPALLDPVNRFFAEITTTQTAGRDAAIAASAGARAGIPDFLSSLLSIFASLSADIRTSTSQKETAVSRVRKRPADLLHNANSIINAVRDALPKGKRLLVIVEDLDKLDIDTAYPIFVRNVNLLCGLDTNIIYTIPVFLFFSPDVEAFRSKFDAVFRLPMIKTSEPPDTDVKTGFDTVRAVVLARVEQSLIADEALDLLVRKTGGVLRHIFQALNDVALMTNVPVPIDAAHIRVALDSLRAELWKQIALPREDFPGRPQSGDELFKRLADYAREQRRGAKPLPKSDGVNQILLRSCVLVEYNGAHWLGVHPLIVEALEGEHLL
jgi:energy-coupling factor transporter ATP-binding protein EcfA2